MHQCVRIAAFYFYFYLYIVFMSYWKSGCNNPDLVCSSIHLVNYFMFFMQFLCYNYIYIVVWYHWLLTWTCIRQKYLQNAARWFSNWFYFSINTFRMSLLSTAIAVVSSICVLCVWICVCRGRNKHPCKLSKVHCSSALLEMKHLWHLTSCHSQ